MIRTLIAGAALLAGSLAPAGAASGVAALAVPAAGQATPTEAAPFVGEWTLTLQGEQGPGTFDLAVKVEQERVVGEITAPGGTPQIITDVVRAGESLVLSYSFDYEGTPVDAAVKLTPAAEGKTTAEISFAGGAYVMSGTAARKDKASRAPDAGAGGLNASSCRA